MDTPQPPGADATTPAAGGAVPTVPERDVPARAAGVELIGEMVGSGYRVPPALARRSDGQVVQLTPLLYAILASTDGHRSYSQIVAIAVVGIWRATGYDALSLVVATQILQMVRQLTPLVRFDGYHVSPARR